MKCWHSLVLCSNPTDNSNGLVNKFMSRCYQLWCWQMPLPILLWVFIYTHTLPPAKRCHTLMKLFEHPGTLLRNSARLTGDATLADIRHQIMISDALTCRCCERQRADLCTDVPRRVLREQSFTFVRRLGNGSSSANLQGNVTVCVWSRSLSGHWWLYVVTRLVTPDVYISEVNYRQASQVRDLQRHEGLFATYRAAEKSWPWKGV